MPFLQKLLFFVLFALLPTGVQAKSDPEALRCLDRFIKKYESLKSYKALIQKKEYDEDGDLARDELVEINFWKPNQLVFIFRNEGTTGIRNNGMTIEYNGGDKVSVKFGESKGLGFIVKGPATLVTGSEKNILDKDILQDDFFTINRAGFGLLASIIKFHFKSVEKARKGGVVMRGPKGSCKVKYTRHTDKVSVGRVKPKDSIFKLEDRFGTLAYQIYRYNHKQFDDFYDLFHRDETVTLRIPQWFFDFELDLDPKTALPQRYVMYIDGKVAANYVFDSITENIPK